MAALSDSNSTVRWVASEYICCLDELAELVSDTMLDTLMAALSDEAGDVRLNVAQALGRIGDPRALHRLAWMAEHDDGDDGHGHEVRRAAVEAITAICGGQNFSQGREGPEQG